MNCTCFVSVVTRQPCIDKRGCIMIGCIDECVCIIISFELCKTVVWRKFKSVSYIYTHDGLYGLLLKAIFVKTDLPGRIFCLRDSVSVVVGIIDIVFKDFCFLTDVGTCLKTIIAPISQRSIKQWFGSHWFF